MPVMFLCLKYLLNTSNMHSAELSIIGNICLSKNKLLFSTILQFGAAGITTHKKRAITYTIKTLKFISIALSSCFILG